MKFPFQHMCWAQHKRCNGKFNLKLIYWWNVIRIPMTANKSTWHWEKDQLVRMEATSVTICSQGKSYTNWSTSAKPEWNAPSTILDSKMKSLEVKMLMDANICSFHKKWILDFWLWDTALVPCFCSPLFCKSTKLHARSRKKRSDFLGYVDWTSRTLDLYVSPIKAKEREIGTYTAPRLL